MNSAYVRDFTLALIVGVLAYMAALHYGLRPGAVAVSAAALTVLFVQLLGGGLGQIGFVPPSGFWRTVSLTLLGIVLFYVFAGGASFLTRQWGFAPDMSSFAYLKGNWPAYVAMLGIAWSSAAFAEEIVFRGFLMNRLRAVDGGGVIAAFTALIVSSALFGAAHFYQGLGGVVTTGAAGLALGILTLVARGNLWPAILTHGIVDTIGLTIFFLGAMPQSS
jgi:hypothetical protein